LNPERNLRDELLKMTRQTTEMMIPEAFEERERHKKKWAKRTRLSSSSSCRKNTKRRESRILS
jgi:hypothetical protein